MSEFLRTVLFYDFNFGDFNFKFIYLLGILLTSLLFKIIFKGGSEN